LFPFFERSSSVLLPKILLDGGPFSCTDSSLLSLIGEYASPLFSLLLPIGIRHFLKGPEPSPWQGNPGSPLFFSFFFFAFPSLVGDHSERATRRKLPNLKRPLRWSPSRVDTSFLDQGTFLFFFLLGSTMEFFPGKGRNSRIGVLKRHQRISFSVTPSMPHVCNSLSPGDCSLTPSPAGPFTSSQLDVMLCDPSSISFPDCIEHSQCRAFCLAGCPLSDSSFSTDPHSSPKWVVYEVTPSTGGHSYCCPLSFSKAISTAASLVRIPFRLAIMRIIDRFLI